MTSVNNIRFGSTSPPPSPFAGKRIVEKPIVPTSAVDEVGYKMGKGFFKLAPRFKNFIDNNLVAGPYSNWFTRRLGGGIKMIFGSLLDQELHKMSGLGPLGKVAVNGTPGLRMILYFGFVICGRLWHASRRAETLPNGKMDRREARDILCRDIPSLALLIFAYDPSVKALTSWLQKRRGIELVHVENAKTGAKELLSYTNLDQAYHLGDPNRINAILANPLNHKGTIDAIDHLHENQSIFARTKRFLGFKTAPNWRISSEHHQLLNAMRAEMLQGQEIAKQAVKDGVLGEQLHARLEAVSQSIFNKLETLGKSRKALLDKAKDTAFSESAAKKAARLIERNVPIYTDMIAKHAQRTRVIADFTGLAVCVAAIGVGVTSFNWWYTEREFKNLMKKRAAEHAKQSETPPAPMNPPAEALPEATRVALNWPTRQPVWPAYTQPVANPWATPWAAPSSLSF